MSIGTNSFFNFSFNFFLRFLISFPNFINSFPRIYIFQNLTSSNRLCYNTTNWSLHFRGQEMREPDLHDLLIAVVDLIKKSLAFKSDFANTSSKFIVPAYDSTNDGMEPWCFNLVAIQIPFAKALIFQFFG